MIKTIAIGQGGGPTSVINSSLAGALYEARARKLKVYGLVNGIEALLDPPRKVMDIGDWDEKRIRTIPGAILGTTRRKISLENEGDKEKIEIMKKNISALGIDAFVYFGGNDSAYVLQALEGTTRIVHGAKTVDNDLMESHHTPGFGSAASYNIRAVKSLAADFFSYAINGTGEIKVAPVAIYQTMGRDTGWLALSTAFARFNEKGYDSNLSPDIVWIPEIEFNKDFFLSRLGNVLSRKGKAVVVVSEGVWQNEGIVKKPIAQFCKREGLCKDEHGHEDFGRSYAGSAAEYLAELVRNELKVDNVKMIKDVLINPQHLQRCYERGHNDAIEAFEVGRETVNAIMDDETGISIVLQKGYGERYNISPRRVPLELIAGKTRYVPPEFYDSINGPTMEFVKEFLPVVGGMGRLPIYYEPARKYVVG